jgi:hypothetical protein
MLLILLLVGCAPTSHRLSVPVPVECRVAEPARPAMPSEHLVPPVDLDPLIAALTAEIELREGYEGELLAALRTCTAPQLVK